MKIVIFELEEWERRAFEGLEAEHELELLEGPLTQQTAEAHAEAEIISTFIYSKLDRAVLERFGNLKMITTRSTGFDHIDLDFCEERGIAVCNVPSYGENTVAEHVFGLLLTISHKLDQAIDRTRKGDFSPRGLQGFDLEGRILGVIGTGNIGQCTIRIARGFGMTVLAHDLKPDPQAAEVLDFYLEGTPHNVVNERALTS